MKFNIYGRCQLEVRRENDAWEVYRQEPRIGGTDDPYLSSELEKEDTATYLDDIYYELVDPGFDGKLLS